MILKAAFLIKKDPVFYLIIGVYFVGATPMWSPAFRFRAGHIDRERQSRHTGLPLHKTIFFYFLCPSSI